MAQGEGEMTGLTDGEGSLGFVGELGLLCDDKIVTYKTGRGEEVDVERLLTIVGVDEMTVLGMVLHARTYTTPHALVGYRIDAIALRTQGGEIDIAASLRILRREDMVPHGLLVEVSIFGIASTVGQHLRELQHVIGVT